MAVDPGVHAVSRLFRDEMREPTAAEYIESLEARVVMLEAGLAAVGKPVPAPAPKAKA